AGQQGLRRALGADADRLRRRGRPPRPARRVPSAAAGGVGRGPPHAARHPARAGGDRGALPRGREGGIQQPPQDAGECPGRRPRRAAWGGARGRYHIWRGPRPSRGNPRNRRICRADRSAIVGAMPRRPFLLGLLAVVLLAAATLGVFAPPEPPRLALAPSPFLTSAAPAGVTPSVRTSSVTLRRGDTLLTALPRLGLAPRPSNAVAEALRASGAD